MLLPLLSLIQKRGKKTYSVSSSKNGRDSIGKRLGVKLGNGALARPNQVIIRQRGYKWHAGTNVYVGRDYTIHAACDGRVILHADKPSGKTFVSVNPLPGLGPKLQSVRDFVNYSFAMFKSMPVANDESNKVSLSL